MPSEISQASTVFRSTGRISTTLMRPSTVTRPGLVSAPMGVTPGVTPIGSLTRRGRATVEGHIQVVEIRPVERNTVLACEVSDGTGQLTALFYGRSHIPGLICGSRVRLQGSAGIRNGQPVMINPRYELVSSIEED